jgi:hypothetical protein
MFEVVCLEPANVQELYKENSFFIHRATQELQVELVFRASLTAGTNTTYGFIDDIDAMHDWWTDGYRCGC